MLFQKDRKRRVIYNDDADQQSISRGGYPYEITDEQSFLDARTTPTFDTHVDTYVWCVGNGASPLWGVWGTDRAQGVHPFLGSYERANDVIVEACHARGMEVWGSLRINDLHDMRAPLEKTNDPLKAQHPEYLIVTPDRPVSDTMVESYLRTAFNFERPEVRQNRIDFIERNAAAHDFDGYELDFTRFPWTLPQGRERELAPLLTDFIRRVRSGLNAIGERRGRPYTFALHVTDSLDTAFELGQDLEAWLSEGLVDVLVVGMGFMPFTIGLDRWRALGDRYGVPIYPALNTRPIMRMYEERRKRTSDWRNYIRAAAAWWWHSQTDGVYLFNLFTHEDTNVGRIDRSLVYEPLREVGDPAALAGKDKLYGIEGSHGMFSQAAEVAALPVALTVHERRLPLNMGPDADNPKARFRLHAWASGGSSDRKVWMRLNHTLLETEWQGDHYSADVPDGVMRVGRNELSVFTDAELDSPMIVNEILTSVTY